MIFIFVIIAIALLIFTYLVECKKSKLAGYSVNLLIFIIKLVFVAVIKYWIFIY